jgi:hypothetical protein
MEALQFPFVPFIQRPGFTSIEQGAENAGFVNMNLGMFSQLVI